MHASILNDLSIQAVFVRHNFQLPLPNPLHGTPTAAPLF